MLQHIDKFRLTFINLSSSGADQLIERQVAGFFYISKQDLRC